MIFSIFRKQIADSPCYQRSGHQARLRQDDSKLIPTVPCGRVNRPGTVLQDLSQPAKCPVPRRMPKAIADLFQSIEVQQEEREFAFGAPGAGDLRM
jgi:hypothetical protein